MDPFSISTGVIGIVSFGVQVLQGLVQYYSSYHGLNESVSSMTSTLSEQAKDLDLLKAVLQRRKYPQDVAKRIEASIASLQKPYRELDAKLQRFRPPNLPMGPWETIKIRLRKTTYPLQESTLKDIRATISESKQNLLVALDLCQLESTGIMDDKISTVAKGVDSVETTVKGTATNIESIATEVQVVRQTVDLFEEALLNNKYIEWLKPPDPSSIHADAVEKRVGDTGRWFLENAVFKKWKTSPSSIMWLHGIPGAGKTVLASTIISDLETSLPDQQSLSFFYFNWQIPHMQKAESLLRSLIGQIYARSKVPEVRKELEDAWKGHANGNRQPTFLALGQLLIKMISRMPQDYYIVVDSLDECDDPSNRSNHSSNVERLKLLKFLASLSESKLPNLHLLLISREEADLEEALTGMAALSVGMEKRLVNVDVREYITHELESDLSLKKRPADLKKLALEKLMADVKGMFRLAELQLEILRNCGSPKDFKQALDTMPDTLDGVYERTLDGIPKDVRSRTRTLLMWLCFANRPLKMQEIEEIFVIDFGSARRFDISGRSFDKEDALKPLRSLVWTYEGIYSDSTFPGRRLGEFAVLSHFSIREYLLSDRICEGKAAMYHMSPEAAHAAVASVCIAYLLHFDGPDSLQEETLEQYPLLKYSAQYWLSHAMAAESVLEEPDGQLAWELSIDLLQSKDAFENSIRVHDPDHDGYESDPEGFMGGTNLKRPSSMIARPIYVAALVGWFRAVKHLLGHGADINSSGGWKGTPLGAAASEGNKEMVKYLISHDADVNKSGGSWVGPPLEAATQRHQVEVLEILLENKADIDARAAQFPDYALGTTALYTAVSMRDPELVEFLLDHGADPSVVCQEAFAVKETALEKAVRCREKDIADIIRDHSTEIPQSVWDADLVAACQKSPDKDEITHLLDKKAAITKDAFIAAANGTSPIKSWIIQELATRNEGVPDLNTILQHLEPHGITTAAVAGILIVSHKKAGKSFDVEEETLAAAARRHDARMVDLVLDFSTHAPLLASKDVVTGAAANVLHGVDILTSLHRRYHDRLEISERALQCAAANPFGPAMLECLWKIHSGRSGVLRPPMNARDRARWMLSDPLGNPKFRHRPLADRIQHPPLPRSPVRTNFSVTPIVLATAARFGQVENMIWLLKNYKQSEIPEIVLCKAAFSSTTRMVILLLALSKHLDATDKDLDIPEFVQKTVDEFTAHDPPRTFELKVSEMSLAAAAQNHQAGEQIVGLLLRCVQPKTQVTARALVAAITSYNMFDDSFRPASLRNIVLRLIQAAGGSIAVPRDIDMNKMTGGEYEESEPSYRPLREVFLVRYAGKTVEEESVDDLFGYLEESQREIGNEEVMVITQVSSNDPAQMVEQSHAD